MECRDLLQGQWLLQRRFIQSWTRKVWQLFSPRNTFTNTSMVSHLQLLQTITHHWACSARPNAFIPWPQPEYSAVLSHCQLISTLYCTEHISVLYCTEQARIMQTLMLWAYCLCWRLPLLHICCQRLCFTWRGWWKHLWRQSNSYSGQRGMQPCPKSRRSFYRAGPVLWKGRSCGHMLNIKQNWVCRMDSFFGGSRVVIPLPEHKQVVEEIHETHPGVSRMKNLARSYVWWPNMDKDLENKAKSCTQCQINQNMPPPTP